MHTDYDSARAVFQRELDALADGATLRLLPGELPGPIVIRRAITLEGAGSTLWATKGPVLTVLTGGVRLKHLRLEVTGADGGETPEARCALRVVSSRDLHLEDVEVRGSVLGLDGEDGQWLHPHCLELGVLPYGRVHTRKMRVTVPVPCQLVSSVAGLELEPGHLVPGQNEVTLRIERLPRDTLINGSLAITTALLTRRIGIGALIRDAGPEVSGVGEGGLLWAPAGKEASDLEVFRLPVPDPLYSPPVLDVGGPVPPRTSSDAGFPVRDTGSAAPPAGPPADASSGGESPGLRSRGRRVFSTPEVSSLFTASDREAGEGASNETAGGSPGVRRQLEAMPRLISALFEQKPDSPAEGITPAATDPGETAAPGKDRAASRRNPGGPPSSLFGASNKGNPTDSRG